MGNIGFYMAHVSLALIVALFIVVFRIRVKNKMRRQFLLYLIELFVWTASVLAQSYSANYGRGDLVIIFENLVYAGVATIAVSILVIGRTFYYASDRKQIRTIVFYIIPVMTQIVIWTNPLHHFFYINYDFFNHSNSAVGWYFYIHIIYSYVCLLAGIYFIFRFAVSSIGNSFWQAILLIIGTVTPFFVNICYTFHILGFTIFSTPFAFIISIIAFFLGVFRYSLMHISPIALKTVIDKTSDLYVVVDVNMKIIDFNKPFNRVFSPRSYFSTKTDISGVLNSRDGTWDEAIDLVSVIDQCKESNSPGNVELSLSFDDTDYCYNVEFSPIVIDEIYCGCLLFFKDVTQATKNMEEMKRSHNMLLEQERLVSIGQLIGGIAHNLKTPIMATTGRTENLGELIEEYKESIGNNEVTPDDHMEIAGEMEQELDKIKQHIAYISDVITAVKDQTIKYNAEIREFFNIIDLIERIKILMQHELVKSNCELVFEKHVSDNLIIDGSINSLVQVINNVVLNAIHAYQGVKGQIRFKITQISERELIFSISDDAGGIPDDVRKVLFRRMITTKGRDGTGLGLYISYSIIVGKFGGRMWFESELGRGTEFLISIPLKEI